MARAGIYKSEVIRARDKIIAMGRYPSIDAIRTELGNTGSKGTIHRYLKEIEEEEGASTGTKVAVSEAIQDLVVRLAERLHEETDARLVEANNKNSTHIQQMTEALAAAKKESESFRQQLENTQLALSEEKARHADTASSLSAETLIRVQLEQQVADMQERLASDEQHRQSLEEKHQHAREALEHFRVSAKEQREQEQRQHEQQVQYLQNELRVLKEGFATKQHEAMHANQENARLTNELSRAKTDLHHAHAELHSLQEVKGKLVSAETHVKEVERRFVEMQSANGELAECNAKLESQTRELAGQVQQSVMEIAVLKASAMTQEQLIEKIGTHLAETKSTKKHRRPNLQLQIPETT
jgi:chromosome segregation ATPase